MRLQKIDGEKRRNYKVRCYGYLVICIVMLCMSCEDSNLIVLMGSGGNSCAKCTAEQTCVDGGCVDKPIDDPCAMCPESCDGIKCSDICTGDDCTSGCTCPEGEKCDGKSCVASCSLNERRCVDDSTLEICKDEFWWDKMNCEKGYYCSQESGNICILDMSGPFTTCQYNDVSGQSDILLKCKDGQCEKYYCRDDGKNEEEKKLMRCAIDRKGHAECVKSDKCSSKNGYVRCAGDNVGVRECNGSTWDRKGTECSAESKICMFVVNETFDNDVVCRMADEQCEMYDYRCSEDKARIEVCIGNKWRLYASCIEHGMSCNVSAESSIPSCR